MVVTQEIRIEATQSNAMGGVLTTIAAAAVMTLFAIACVYPGMLFRGDLPTSADLYQNDLWDQNVPLRVWGANSLARAHLPLWYPGCFRGVPLASLPEAVPYYLPSTFFYLTLPPIPATAGTIIFHLVIAGIGAALLARHFGASLGGQVLAAILMSVGLHLPMHARQLNILQAQAWIPLAWLFVDRILFEPDRRRIAGLGFSLGMLGLAGHPQILHHTIMILAIWACIRIANNPEKGGRRFWLTRLIAVVSAGVIAVAIALPNLGPILESSHLANRTQMFFRFSPPFDALFTFLNPLTFGSPLDVKSRFFRYGPWEQMFYMGLASLAMAVVYACLRFRTRLCRDMLIVMAATLFFAYAPGWVVTRWLVDLIPMQSSSRFPHRYFFYFYVGMIIFAALGMSSFLRWISNRSATFRRPLVLCAIVSVVIAATLFDLARATRLVNPYGDVSAVFEKPASLGLLEKAGASPDAFGEALLPVEKKMFITKTQKARAGWHFYPELERELYCLFLSEQPSMWNWPVLDGYAGIVPVWPALIMGSQYVHGFLPVNENDTSRNPQYIYWSGFYGGRWLASTSEFKMAGLKFIGRIPGNYFSAWLYENLSWPGPAWISRKILLFDNDDRAIENMVRQVIRNVAPDTNTVRLTREFLPSSADFTQPAQPLDLIIKPVYPDPEHVTIDCRLSHPGFLVMNQSWHPRWRVRIDHGPFIKTTRVNVSQMAVWLGAGKHHIEFVYRGLFEKFCIAIGLVGLVAVCLLAFAPRRQSHTISHTA